MISCVSGKKIIASQCFDVVFVFKKDHIWLVDDKKVTEAT